MKKSTIDKVFFYVLVILILLCILISLHTTTIRYLDENGASIQPDKEVMVWELPFCTKVDGYYKVGDISYKSKKHLFEASYKPKNNPLRTVNNAKYLGVTFQPTTVPITHKTQKDPYNLNRSYSGTQTARDTLRILVGTSPNSFKILPANYPAENVRDPSLTKIDNRYYIIYTRGLMYTEDFNHWKKLTWPHDNEFKYNQEWAPEFATDSKGNKYVVMSAVPLKKDDHKLFITSFQNGRIAQNWQEITGNLPKNVIDPSIYYYNGRYYLFCKNENNKNLVMGISSTINGPYTVHQIKLSVKKFDAVEGPEAIIRDNKIILYFDTYNITKDGNGIFYGVHYSKSSLRGQKWSDIRIVKSSTLIRHGYFFINN